MRKSKPNSKLMAVLTSMGIKEWIAKQALLKTGNKSLEAAIDYVFNNYYSQIAESAIDPDRKCLMAFVVNVAMGLSLGEMAVRVAGASINLYRQVSMSEMETDNMLELWEEYREKMVIFKGLNHVHLKRIEDLCIDAGLATYMAKGKGSRGLSSVLAIFGYDESVEDIICDLTPLP